MKVFISYSKSNKTYAENLKRDLEKNGCDVFYDGNLTGGTNVPNTLRNELISAIAVVFIATSESVHSDWVLDELSFARHNGKRIIPIMYDNITEAELPVIIARLLWLDARGGRNISERLLTTLRQLSQDGSNQINQKANKTRTFKSDINSHTFRICPLAGSGMFYGNRVGLNPLDKSRTDYAILKNYPFDVDEIRLTSVPVKIFTDQNIPRGILLVGNELAENLDINADNSADWELEHNQISAVKLQELHIEITVEEQLEQAIKRIGQSTELSGKLLIFENNAEFQSFEIDDVPLKVNKIVPAPLTRAICEITEETKIFLLSPGTKTGVDIVVLADCSGSMSIDDLTDTRDFNVIGFNFTSGVRNIPRSTALQRSLNQLLEIRLRTEGRASFMAIVAFTTESVIRFPKNGKGMAQIDGSSPTTSIREFKDAIGFLIPQSAGTNIGQALSFGAEILCKYGQPKNDRLIVLISDGASWSPKGEDQTGEVISGTQDEISLMEGFYENQNINLHAIGVSNKEIFNVWWKKKHPGKLQDVSSIPNHELLAKLVEVGGGDSTRVGDSNVLEEYFSGLGSGITKEIRCQNSIGPRSLTSQEIALINSFSQQTGGQKEASLLEDKKESVITNLLQLISNVNLLSHDHFGDKFFLYKEDISELEQILKSEFININEFQLYEKIIWGAGNSKIRNGSNNFDILPAIATFFNGTAYKYLTFLKNKNIRDIPQNDNLGDPDLLKNITNNPSLLIVNLQITVLLKIQNDVSILEQAFSDFVSKQQPKTSQDYFRFVD